MNLGPADRSFPKTTSGVSRLAGQAGTQATDPTPKPNQNRGSRAGALIHILPAEYARPEHSEFSFADVTERLLMRDDTRYCRRCVDLSGVVVPVDGPAVVFAELQFTVVPGAAGRAAKVPRH